MIPLRRVPLVIELARRGELRVMAVGGCSRDSDPSEHDKPRQPAEKPERKAAA